MIFGDARGFGDTPLVSGVVFHNDDAARDFINGLPAGNWRDGGGDWPSQAGLISAAASAVAAGRGGGMVMAMQPVADNISNLQRFGLGGRSASQDSQYRAAMSQLRSMLAQVAGTGTSATGGGLLTGGAAGGAGMGMGFGMDTNTMLLIGAAGIAAIVLLKRRRPAAAAPAPAAAVAGYRRRRRARR